jgi:hypothetical protein
LAPAAVRLVLDGYLEAVAEVFFPTAEVPSFPSLSFHSFSSDSSDDDPSSSKFTTSLMPLSPGVLVAVRAGSKILTEQQGDLLAVPGVGRVFAKFSSSSHTLGHRPLRCFQIRRFLPFACKFEGPGLMVNRIFCGIHGAVGVVPSRA